MTLKIERNKATKSQSRHDLGTDKKDLGEERTWPVESRSRRDSILDLLASRIGVGIPTFLLNGRTSVDPSSQRGEKGDGNSNGTHPGVVNLTTSRKMRWGRLR